MTQAELLKLAIIENIATIAVTGATICGLWWLGANGHSLWALALLLNLNTFKSKS